MSDNTPGMTPEQERLLTEIAEGGEEHDDVLKDILRLKWLPFGGGYVMRHQEQIEAFLAMSDDEQSDFMKPMSNERAEFWIEVLTARALYQDPVDKRDGSITEAKVAAYPDRYDWKP